MPAASFLVGPDEQIAGDHGEVALVVPVRLALDHDDRQLLDPEQILGPDAQRLAVAADELYLGGGGQQLLLGRAAAVPGGRAALVSRARLERQVEDGERGPTIDERLLVAGDVADHHDVVVVLGLLASLQDPPGPGRLGGQQVLLAVRGRRVALCLRAFGGVPAGAAGRRQGGQGGQSQTGCEAEHERHSSCGWNNSGGQTAFNASTMGSRMAWKAGGNAPITPSITPVPQPNSWATPSIRSANVPMVNRTAVPSSKSSESPAAMRDAAAATMTASWMR